MRFLWLLCYDDFGNLAHKRKKGSDNMELQQQVEQMIVNSRQGMVCLSFADLKTGAHFSVNGNKVVPSASIIKLLILAELLRRVDAGELSLDDTLTVTAKHWTGGDGVLKELAPGHTFTLKELATLMIIVSDNEATNLLIDLLGMENINRMGARLGLKAAHLGRRMMDAKALQEGRDNFISSDDAALILQKVYRGSLVSKEASALMLDILKHQQQGDRLQRYLPEDVPLAHKCGDLTGVENDAGIFLLPEHPYILVVLTSRQPSAAAGKGMIGKLSLLVYQQVLKG
jgi:beta-lactamase class A